MASPLLAGETDESTSVTGPQLAEVGSVSWGVSGAMKRSWCIYLTPMGMGLCGGLRSREAAVVWQSSGRKNSSRNLAGGGTKPSHVSLRWVLAHLVDPS